ncbi:MAG: hypothetical protein V3W00_00975 [Candidatus Brocadiales bacterium]
MERFQGYHSEWNLGSPGGWEYQRMTMELGKWSWERIQELTGLDLLLDFENMILNPRDGFIDLMLSVHKRGDCSDKKPFIVVTAEEKTLNVVMENRNTVDCLNSLTGISAALAAPEQIEQSGDTVTLDGKEITALFMDFNNDVLLELKKRHDIGPLLTAIGKGIVVNPRGTDPINSKAVFEAVHNDLRDHFSESTLSRTPWTRLFRERSTTGPQGEDIPDLVEWVRRNWERVVLKPEKGHSGEGVFVGCIREDRDGDIQESLERNDYIVQEVVHLDLWAEEFPWLDHERKEVFLKKWQTDFRCMMTERGLIGFLGRFGGIPTNVGSGGGTHGIAILHSPVSVREAVDRMNEAILGLGYATLKEIQDEIDRKAIQMGLVYTKGPIKTLLRPRIITLQHLEELKEYVRDVWQDSITLEKLWREGSLDNVVHLTADEKELALLQPWEGSPALFASDGLFSFGAHVGEWCLRAPSY